MTVIDNTASDARQIRRARRGELGAFLKSRRARITPADVGLPAGPRRRTPGLRREEVAQLAGVGLTWYTWLEQGREINVSVQVLDAVARTLALDPVERAHLYRLADVPTVPGWDTEETIPEELQGILDHLYPLPAALLSARYDVLAHNAAYAALTPGFVGGDRNVLRRVFLTPCCCNPYPGQGEHLCRMVGFLRTAYAKNLHDPEWTAFVEDLCARSPRFAALWARNDVAAPLGRYRMIRNLASGDMEVILTSMSVPTISGAWVQIFTPADDSAWEKLRSLLAMSPEERERPWREHYEREHARATA
ncbi:helix-turn-helix transcriptional regulator [Nocardia sp. CDC159]|uniref:Helix-turn-helix transcriptional regulator n=1 Tax=Nocardia pulmonis TaxID=2951408 RepID=A0A9X2J283_9NOCA|nr:MULTISPECIES: helix-turn-helix transcriptional regulator [Nocardia]MCM6778900.1 helix-turn-helix transcriptional regulator [Nocardia pulmonis]MCM6791789.1 helix-turn-helix transcriptional regulator [Nocardia sp. CDC159]